MPLRCRQEDSDSSENGAGRARNIYFTEAIKSLSAMEMMGPMFAHPVSHEDMSLILGLTTLA